MMSLKETQKKKSSRLLTLDAARGLAVIGMYIQHFALNNRNANIISGNTMILFILCSGISFTLMNRNAKRRDIETERFRAKVIIRALFIDLLGYLIIMLNGPFGVVLSAYAGLFIIALGFRDLSDRVLTVITVVLFFVSPIIMIVGMSIFSDSAMLLDLAGSPI